jgi:hypothetical protein
MRLLLPGLLSDSALRDHALDGVRLPWLERMLARAAHSVIAAEGTEAALCELLGIARQTDWPIAPIALLADGVDPGAHAWLRADPVHLALRRDHVAILPVDALDAEEAAVLARSLGEHFSGEAAFLAPHPMRWYVRLAAPATVRTVPAALAYGRDLARAQPQGDAGARLRAFMNEAQIVLHNHPLNAQREARGARAVNGVWPWGGGVLPERPTSAGPGLRMHATATDALALGRFASGEDRTVPSPLADDRPACAGMAIMAMTARGRPARDDIVVLNDVAEAAASEDPARYRDTLMRLDDALFAPLWKRGLPLVVDDPRAGLRLTLSRWQRWRVWKRPRPVHVPAPLSMFAAGEPAANIDDGSNMDQFGNRF